jgi:3-deoxy-D-manno-octulosonic-acid transferase
MENFRDMAAQFLAAKAGVEVTNGQQLGKVWVELVGDNALRERMGQAARVLTERNRGATARSLERIAAVLDEWEPPA